MGEARKSISDYYLPRTMDLAQAEKRPRTDQLEVPVITLHPEPAETPETMTSASTETVVERNTNQSDTMGNRHAIRHDRLLDKIDRYNSHNEFLRRCIATQIIPLSYKVTVEPSIGNHDEAFLKGYYDILDGCSKQLMTYTADYCVKKQTEFKAQEQTSREELKASTTPQDFAELQKTFDINQKKREKALQDIKEKKYIRLKYKSQHQTRAQFYTEQNSNKGYRHDNQNREIPSRRPSRTNLSGRPPSRKNSYSNLGARTNSRQYNATSTERQNGFNNKIEDLERQLNELRKQSYSGAVTNTNPGRSNGKVINNRFIPNRDNNDWSDDSSRPNQNAIPQERKNTNPSHPAHGGYGRNDNTQQMNNVEVTEVLDYISTAMQTLGEFEKRFKQRINTTPTPSATS